MNGGVLFSGPEVTMRLLKSAVCVSVGLVLVTPFGRTQAVPSPAVQTAQSITSLAPNTPQTLDVVYEKGRLYIFGHDVTLKQVLDAVHEKTGALLDVPLSLSSGKLAVEIGPDDPERVLASLLYGTGLNYAVVGSVAEGNMKIVLMLRTEPTVVQAPAVVAAVPNPPAEADQVATTDTDDAKVSDKSEKDEAADEKTKDKDKDKDKDAVAGNKTDQPNGDSGVLADKSDDGTKPDVQTPALASEKDRLTDLPPNINPAIAALYPSLASGGTSSTGTQSMAAGTSIGTSSNGVTMGGATQITAAPPPHNTYLQGASVAVDGNGAPVLPSNIPQQMWGLYPSNLMQLITSNTAPPAVPQTPLAPGVPSTTGGQSLFWDQTLRTHP